MQPLEALLATFVIMAIMLLVELRVVLLAEVERIRLVKAVQLLVTVRTARVVIMALEKRLFLKDPRRCKFSHGCQIQIISSCKLRKAALELVAGEDSAFSVYAL